MAFSFAHIISSVVQVSKSQEKVSGWLSLSLRCGDGLRKGRRRELLISSVSEKGGNFCLPSDCAGRRKLKGVLVLLRKGLCENETNALNHLSQCCLQELGSTSWWQSLVVLNSGQAGHLLAQRAGALRGTAAFPSLGNEGSLGESSTKNLAFWSTLVYA